MKKENETFITEISEEDFRKLHLVGYKQIQQVFETSTGHEMCKIVWKEVDLNKELDETIQFLLDFGYETNLEELKRPFTIAIHKENGPDPRNYYWDKFMNRFGGPQTYQTGIGIKHLYVTRDYFEDKEDHWRVSKRETKAIYRIHFDKKWVEQFVIKHKTERQPWPYSDEPNCFLDISYNLDEKTGEFVECYRSKVVKNEHSTSYFPVDKDGNLKNNSQDQETEIPEENYK